MRVPARTPVLAILAAAVTASGQQDPQKPTFRAATNLVLIDAQVVARDGAPIQGLTKDQFEVFIDGRRRPIVSAEFQRASHQAPATITGAAALDGATVTRDGRIIVIAVDQNSFPPVARSSAQEAVRRVIEKAAADDYVGLIAFPGTLQISPTRDRRDVLGGLDRIAGLRVDLNKQSRFNLSGTEAAILAGRVPVAMTEVICRACSGDSTSRVPLPNCVVTNSSCRDEVIADGVAISTALEQQGMISIAGLHAVLDAVTSLAGRKTLIVVSAGLPTSNLPNGRPNLTAETERIARRAAAANVNLYVFYINTHFMRVFSAEYGRRNYTLYEDISLFGSGLERFADSGGGAFFQVEVDSDPFIERALRETTASYVLAVEADVADRDGKEHFVRVTVRQRGATLRYRRIVVIPAER